SRLAFPERAKRRRAPRPGRRTAAHSCLELPAQEAGPSTDAEAPELRGGARRRGAAPALVGGLAPSRRGHGSAGGGGRPLAVPPVLGLEDLAGDCCPCSVQCSASQLSPNRRPGV